MSRRRAACRGMTMLELIVVGVVVFLIVGGVLLSLAGSGTQLWTRSDSHMVNATMAQQAMNRVTEELRTARRQTLNCPDSGATTLLCFGPISGAQTVCYFRNPTDNQFMRLRGSTTQVMAGGITEFRSTCAPGSELVSISLTVQGAGFGGASTPQTLFSQVWVPNP